MRSEDDVFGKVLDSVTNEAETATLDTTSNTDTDSSSSSSFAVNMDTDVPGVSTERKFKKNHKKPVEAICKTFGKDTSNTSAEVIINNA